jgi:hypothetical protein
MSFESISNLLKGIVLKLAVYEYKLIKKMITNFTKAETPGHL